MSLGLFGREISSDLPLRFLPNEIEQLTRLTRPKN